MKLKADVIPFSSIVGIAIMNEDGIILGCLSLRGFQPAAAEQRPVGADEHRREYIALCKRVADAINAGQPETRAKHLKTGGTYDVLGEAIGQGGIFENEKAIVYRQPGGGKLFFRVPGEFFDGRFEEVTQP